jgi:hypothetical protein
MNYPRLIDVMPGGRRLREMRAPARMIEVSDIVSARTRQLRADADRYLRLSRGVTDRKLAEEFLANAARLVAQADEIDGTVGGSLEKTSGKL